MASPISPAARSSLYERSLLLAAQHGDRRAEAQLLERYERLLAAAVNRCRLPARADRDDMAQEARIAFVRAIGRWRPERGSFAAFARACVRHHVLHALATAAAEKHRVLDRACSLDEADASSFHGPSPGGARRLADRAVGGGRGDPETVVLMRERIDAVRRAMGSLSEWERTALRASLNGISHRELALEHGVSVRAVTLAVRRARHKLAQQSGWAQAA